MLYYTKNCWSLSTLLAWYGSAFPRTLPFSLLASGIAVAVSMLWKDKFRILWVQPHPFQIFALVTGFMLVLRCALPAVLVEPATSLTESSLRFFRARKWSTLQQMHQEICEFC